MSSLSVSKIVALAKSAPSRVRLNLDGRFMRPSKEEFPCRVPEMSTGDMVIATEIDVQLGEMLVIYIPELGRFEGIIDRREDEAFVLSMSLTQAKHKKLAEQLVWFGNRDILDLPEGRQSRRIVPLSQWTTVRLANGVERMAKINDISTSGINVEVSVLVQKARLLVGSRVMIGSKAAKILRIFEGGFVATFEEPISPDDFNETIRL